MSPIPEIINPGKTAGITGKIEGNTFEKEVRNKELHYGKGTNMKQVTWRIEACAMRSKEISASKLDFVCP